MKHCSKVLLVSAGILFFSARTLPGSAGPADGERLTTEVRLYNDVRVPIEQVGAAEEVASRVLWQAGVQLNWSDCTVNRSVSGSVSSLCDSSIQSTALLVYFVGPLESHFHWVDQHALGYSIPDGNEPATMAYISYSRIQRLSASTSAGVAGLLGLTVAHEIAHLLFGSHEHANQGIMRASWPWQDLHAEAWNKFQFTQDEVRRLRAAVRVGLDLTMHSRTVAHRKEPTKEGALEYSPEFRKVAAEAWEKVGYGNRPRPEQGSPEAGFTIDRNGKINVVKVTAQERGAGEMKFVIGPETLAVFHTHSDPWIRRPSTGDEASARSNHMQIYTATKDGLFLTGPDGNTAQIFKRDDWATAKNPK